jgi:hypothetical protein
LDDAFVVPIVLGFIRHYKWLRRAAVLDKCPEQRNSHKHALFAEMSVGYSSFLIDDLDQSLQQGVILLFGHLSSNLSCLTLLFGDESHYQSKTVQEDVFIFVIQKIHNNLEPILLEKDILDVF